MRRFSRLLTLVAALTAAATACAQVRDDSHQPISPNRAARDLANQLQKGIGLPPPPSLTPQQLQKLKELFEKNDPQSLQQRLNNDPELERWLRQIAKDHPDLGQAMNNRLTGNPEGNDPASGDRLREMFRKMQSDLAQRGTGANPNLPNITGGPPGTPPSQPGTIPPPPGTSLPPIGGAGEIPRLKAPTEDRLRNLTRGLDRFLPKTTTDNSTVKRLMSDLGKSDFSKTASDRFRRGPQVSWDKIGNRLKGSGRFLDRNLGRINFGGGPRISSRKLPQMPNAPSLPSVGSPGGPSMGGVQLGSTATALMVLVVMALAGFLLWRYLIRQAGNRKTSLADEALGPWPVDPKRIATRAELVRAFDYLALLQCGRDAKMWHHRHVANRLGGDDGKRTQTAGSLADVYEHARYAPLRDDLAGDRIDRARRDLCFLAGVDVP
jgi:hypothetical protein